MCITDVDNLGTIFNLWSKFVVQHIFILFRQPSINTVCDKSVECAPQPQSCSDFLLPLVINCAFETNLTYAVVTDDKTECGGEIMLLVHLRKIKQGNNSAKAFGFLTGLLSLQQLQDRQVLMQISSQEETTVCVECQMLKQQLIAQEP